MQNQNKTKILVFVSVWRKKWMKIFLPLLNLKTLQVYWKRRNGEIPKIPKIPSKCTEKTAEKIPEFFNNFLGKFSTLLRNSSDLKGHMKCFARMLTKFHEYSVVILIGVSGFSEKNPGKFGTWWIFSGKKCRQIPDFFNFFVTKVKLLFLSAPNWFLP